MIFGRVFKWIVPPSYGSFEGEHDDSPTDLLETHGWETQFPLVYMQAHVGKKIFDKNAHSFLSLNIFSGLDCDMHLVLGDTKVNLSDLCCIFVATTCTWLPRCLVWRASDRCCPTPWTQRICTSRGFHPTLTSCFAESGAPFFGPTKCLTYQS